MKPIPRTTQRWADLDGLHDFAPKPSMFRRRDARALLLTAALFVVMVASVPPGEVSALVPYSIFPLLWLADTGIPPRWLGRKLLIASPFVLAVAFVSAVGSRTAAEDGPMIAPAGYLSMLSILLRFLLTVGAVLLLVATAGLRRLCAALTQFRVPAALVTQLLLLGRYTVLLTDEALRMLRGFRMRARSVADPRLAIYGPLLGQLLLRALDRSERIHRAMTSRGFRFDLPLLHREHWRRADTFFLVAWVSFFALARRWNLSRSLGDLVLQTFALL